MTEGEIEKLAELIAIKTSERYLKITKEHVDTQIKLHESECSAKKYSKGENFVSAAIGGIIVAIVSWWLRGK